MAVDVARDTESKARIQGVKSQMNTFRFAFGTMLAEMILRHTDNLSRSLQDKVCSAAEGQTIGAMPWWLTLSSPYEMIHLLNYFGLK